MASKNTGLRFHELEVGAVFTAKVYGGEREYKKTAPVSETKLVNWSPRVRVVANAVNTSNGKRTYIQGMRAVTRVEQAE